MNERLTRKGKYQVDIEFENILQEMNKALRPINDNLSSTAHEGDLPPLIFFCFAPRTGSTLISQVLARTGEFSYVSNYVARFWEAPYLSMIIEKKLDLRQLNEHKIYPGMLKSDYGTTFHFAEPHEFGFFWNKLLPNNETHFIEPGQVPEQQATWVRQQINAMRRVYNKPFFIKNGIIGYNPAVIKQLFPDAWFVVIQRDWAFVAQSIFLGRLKIFGNTKEWLSLRPKEYKKIRASSASEFEEIAGQIKYIYRNIEDGIKGSENRVLRLSYEAFCANPKKLIDKIFSLISYTPGNDYPKLIPDKLANNNHIKVDPGQFKQIEKAINKIAG